MLNSLALLAAALVAQTPDFIDVEPSGSGYRMLAAGGWLYRWRPGGEVMLEAKLDAPAVDLLSCDGARAVAVGPGGAVFVAAPLGPFRRVGSMTAADLWAVAGEGCREVLAVGNGGTVLRIHASEDPVRVEPLPAPTDRPLYGVAISRGQAIAAGAGGVVLRRDGAGPWSRIDSGTEVPFLAVAAVEPSTFALAAAGGLWLLEGGALRQVYSDDREVFTRVAFLGKTGLAVGGASVVVTADGGQTWTRRALPDLLAAAAMGAGRFLVVGREGKGQVVEVQAAPQPSRASTGRSRPTAPAEKEPEARGEAAASAERPPGLPKPTAPRRLPAEPKCLQTIAFPENVVGFVDVRRVPAGLLVASGDGSIRLARGDGLPIHARTDGPVLGLAAARERPQVAAVGAGFVARSSDGGQRFRIEPLPEKATAFAAAFVGKDLLVFDVRGNAYRLPEDEEARPVRLPRRVTSFGASFADDRRGYVVGACGTLLETVDGGASFEELAAPTAEPQGVLALGETVFVAGEGGLFRSDDRGRTFTQLITAKMCIRIAARERAVAVACADLGRSIWYAPDGWRFAPVPLPDVFALLAVAIEPDGEMVAVGSNELLVRARPTGGRVAYRSAAVRQWEETVELLHRDAARPRQKVARTVRSPGTGAPVRVDANAY